MQLGRLFFILTFFSVLSSHASDFTSQMDIAGVVKDMTERGGCVDRSTFSLCRRLPWIPRLHEGVIERNGAGYIILDNDLPADSMIEKWSKKFSDKDRQEMVSYFLVNNPEIALAVSKSPFTVIYLLMIKKVNESYKIVSVSMNPSAQIPNEVASQFNVVQGEINGHRGTDWIPPMSFTMGHQFKLNDTL